MSSSGIQQHHDTLRKRSWKKSRILSGPLSTDGSETHTVISEISPLISISPFFIFLYFHVVFLKKCWRKERLDHEGEGFFQRNQIIAIGHQTIVMEETEKENGENDLTWAIFDECQRCRQKDVTVIEMKTERLDKIYRSGPLYKALKIVERHMAFCENTKVV